MGYDVCVFHLQLAGQDLWLLILKKLGIFKSSHRVIKNHDAIILLHENLSSSHLSVIGITTNRKKPDEGHCYKMFWLYL